MASPRRSRENKQFELRGVNHLALSCKDMARTVDFYSNVLGMPLIKTLDLPFGSGQHFFFDIGNGDSLAFFWFPDAPEAAPGVASPPGLPGRGPITTAHGSMNHLAFDVAPEKMEEYREKLIAAGVEVTEIVNHDNSPMQTSETVTDDVYVRSLYFFDPDGILLEFAAWTRELGPDETRHRPARAEDAPRYLEVRERAMREYEARRKR
jgi:catechol 2,3-dioxygenase-like lactoylglutathione lyase family enzyme